MVFILNIDVYQCTIQFGLLSPFLQLLATYFLLATFFLLLLTYAGESCSSSDLRYIVLRGILVYPAFLEPFFLSLPLHTTTSCAQSVLNSFPLSSVTTLACYNYLPALYPVAIDKHCATNLSTCPERNWSNKLLQWQIIKCLAKCK